MTLADALGCGSGADGIDGDACLPLGHVVVALARRAATLDDVLALCAAMNPRHNVPGTTRCGDGMPWSHNSPAISSCADATENCLQRCGLCCSWWRDLQTGAFEESQTRHTFARLVNGQSG
jgi:hypothetical protein